MPYKPNYKGAIKSQYYKNGEITEYIAMINETERHRAQAEKVLREERELRKSLNTRIAELILQGNLSEKEILETIESEFPDENAERIITIIKHWEDKVDKLEERVNVIVDGVVSGTISRKTADVKMNVTFGKNQYDRKIAKKHYNDRMKQLEEKEEER